MHNQMMSEIGRAIRNTLGDALDRAVRRTPDKIALLFAERRWTYCDLAAAANLITSELLAIRGRR
jgi:fatty-acyl-CoA synthase